MGAYAHSRLLGLISFMACIALLCACSSTHNFQSKSIDPSREITISGTLYKPKGNGPFPAIVLMHGCSGINKNHHNWASRLKRWGYVTMIIDSHGPRGIYNNCKYPSKIAVTTIALDAENAKNYLSSLSFVDSDRIGYIGFSQGGRAALALASYDFSSGKEKSIPFKAGVAYYPNCRVSLEVINNILILIGEKDDWTPASACVNSPPYSTDNVYEVELKVYPDAYHCFDHEGLDKIYEGHVVKYNYSAAIDAKNQTKLFFDKHLKGMQ